MKKPRPIGRGFFVHRAIRQPPLFEGVEEIRPGICIISRTGFWGGVRLSDWQMAPAFSSFGEENALNYKGRLRVEGMPFSGTGFLVSPEGTNTTGSFADADAQHRFYRIQAVRPLRP